MPIKADEYGQVCVLTLTGDLAAEEPATVRHAVEQAIDQRQIVDFVLDLEKVGFIDSEGLETLVWIKRKCDDLFGRLKLASIDENCRKILEITRLAQRFDCHADAAAALKTMR